MYCIIAEDPDKGTTHQVTGCYREPGEAWRTFNFYWPPKEEKVWHNPRRVRHEILVKQPGSSLVTGFRPNILPPLPAIM